MSYEFNSVIYFILRPPKMGERGLNPLKLSSHYISSDCNKILRHYCLMSGEFNAIIYFLTRPPYIGGIGVKPPKMV